ncbi:hypothetical protein T265_02710 [Opisthorchis viverrini]|uniref:Uncharacterized protein n=1 Tax=Opisthorchis viverrini TaxID=6198 RepID=A0A075AI25_OPIVI|nr:hypothetical protein T265_02710 [Opisthorchis viverrini]KER30894.1 hypothetical protein T265_02710 [Opisthorchis viverrini]
MFIETRGLRLPDEPELEGETSSGLSKRFQQPRRAQTEEKAHVQRVTHPQGHHRYDTSGKSSSFESQPLVAISRLHPTLRDIRQVELALRNSILCTTMLRHSGSTSRLAMNTSENLKIALTGEQIQPTDRAEAYVSDSKHQPEKEFHNPCGPLTVLILKYR